MEPLGAGAAVLVSATRTEDVLGVRTSHVPGPTYTHDVYSADLKIAGLGRRLGINLGPAMADVLGHLRVGAMVIGARS